MGFNFSFFGFSPPKSGGGLNRMKVVLLSTSPYFHTGPRHGLLQFKSHSVGNILQVGEGAPQGETSFHTWSRTLVGNFLGKFPKQDQVKDLRVSQGYALSKPHRLFGSATLNGVPTPCRQQGFPRSPLGANSVAVSWLAGGFPSIWTSPPFFSEQVAIRHWWLLYPKNLS